MNTKFLSKGPLSQGARQKVVSVARYERKFVLQNTEAQTIQGSILLHPALFREIYSPRYVNSVYFDTPDLVYYCDSLHGVRNRIKIRMRWYGMLTGVVAAQLEVKRKNGFLVHKEIFALESCYWNAACGPFGSIHTMLRANNDLPIWMQEYCRGLLSVVLVRYVRRYFQSIDRRYRLTIDSGVEYYNAQRQSKLPMERASDDERIVLEIKYHERDDGRLQFITNYLPFRLTKSSKYCMAVEALAIS